MTNLTKFDSGIESFLGLLAPIYSNLVDLANRNDDRLKEERAQQMLVWHGEHKHALAGVFKQLVELQVSVQQLEALVSDPRSGASFGIIR